MKQTSSDGAWARLRILGKVIGSLFIAVALIPGCKPKDSTPAGPVPLKAQKAGKADHYFKTPFQTEGEFIVYAVLTDLAEQMYYAVNHQLPDEKTFLVTIAEKPDSAAGSPVYKLQIRLDPKLPELNCELAITQTIWSAQNYETVATQIAQAVGLTPTTSNVEGDTTLLDKLKDNRPETIERENQRLSSALEKNFSDADLHEQAALLLGAFTLREHSGKFFEIRSPLSRLTAHLAMAQFLRGRQPAGVSGQIAEAMMLTLVGNQSQALERLKNIGTNNPAALPLVRALQVRNTGDYRLLDKADNLSRVEFVAWFAAWADYVSPTVAWPKLKDGQKQTADFVRVANELNYSVEVGHELGDLSIPLEMEETKNVYELAQHKPLPEKKVVEALNELPDRCFTRAAEKPAVHVIGWGQWAAFLQRHLCHAVQQNHYFMSAKWGVPDEAKEMAAKCEELFSGLRLYPFVRRFTCFDVKSYHQAVDDGFKITVATPQFVSAECWNFLCYKVNFAPLYQPVANPHVNNWHNHNPLPGTIYDLNPRLYHPSFTGQSDIVARFEQVHQMAPYDCRIIGELLKRKYNENPTYEQAAGLYGPLLEYSGTAMRTVAGTVYDQPDQYRKWMLQLAAVNPVGYYDLGDYEAGHKNPDDAAKFFERASTNDADSVRIASRAPWRVRYYLGKGDVKKAQAIADDGGEVYSSRGLEAKALFFELTTNYDGALEWYGKIEERYGDSKSLVGFFVRYKQSTGDARFESEMKKRQKSVFPKGLEKVSLATFKRPPADGVLIQQKSALLDEAGLRTGDVILALNGTRVHGFDQYTYLRSLLVEPEMRLIVWQNGSYHELKASPPNHLFGAPFGDYKPQ